MAKTTATNKPAPAAVGSKPGHNSDKLKAMRATALERIKKLGAKAGAADLSLGELFTQTIKDADNGIISLDKPAIEGTPDDAMAYALGFANARASAGLGDAKDGVIKKNASVLRQAISASTLPGIDFGKVSGEVFTTFADMKKKGAATRQLFEAYASAAREQIKQKTKELSKDQIEECCAPFVKTEKDKTPLDFLNSVLKKCEKQHEEADAEFADGLESIIETVREAIKNLGPDEEEAPKSTPIGSSKPAKPAVTSPSKPKPATPKKKADAGSSAAMPRNDNGGDNAPLVPASVASPLGPPSPIMDGTMNQIKAFLDNEDGNGTVTASMLDATTLAKLRRMGLAS